ncbi:MAG: thioredoxin family protein [Lentisphaeria bacterium]|nr:thioredoxin family protein [Lentisphaeria bacterium]
MKRFLIAVLCAGVMVGVWSAEKKSTGVKWENDILSAQKSLKGAKQKCILLYFTAPGWCGPCRMLEKGPLATAEFAAVVRKNAAVKVDFSDRNKITEGQRKLLREFEVQGFPTLIVLDANGKEKGRLVGYLPEKNFFAQLDGLMSGKGKNK